jgi:hypothetical protein
LEIPASDTTDTNDISTTIGRIELLQTLWTACGCHVHCRHGHDDINNNDNDNDTDTDTEHINHTQHENHYLTGRGCTTNKCTDCRAVTDWSKRYLPRAWVRIRMQHHQRLVSSASASTSTRATTVDAADSTHAAGEDAASAAAPSVTVSLEFKASQYPVETLVRIFHHHPETQQQQHQQQKPSSLEEQQQ